MRDFNGRVAVITGGATGIGRALGALLASRNANVAEAASVEALADAVFKQHGRVHLLFNNAGVSLGVSRVRAWSLPLQDSRWGMEVNFVGVVHGVRAFVPRMVAGGEEGAVVNTTSPSDGLGRLSRLAAERCRSRPRLRPRSRGRLGDPRRPTPRLRTQQ